MNRKHANHSMVSKQIGCLLFACILALSASAESRLVPREAPGDTTGHKLGIGSFLVDEGTNEVALVDLFFYTHDESGRKTPCFVRDMNMRPDYMDRGLSLQQLDQIRDTRRHETGGGKTLAGSDKPKGVSGARFAAVAANYEGKSFSLFVKGTTYTLTLYPPFRYGEEGKKASLKKARVKLEIPETLEKGKRYAVDWLLTEYEEETPPTPKVFAIQGTVEGAMLENRHPHMSAWYFTSRGLANDPSMLIGQDGRFILKANETERPLVIYDKFGHTGSALCLVRKAGEKPMLLPRDADEVFDKKHFVEARLHMPDEFRHDRDFLVIGAYREPDNTIPLALDSFSTDGKKVGQSIRTKRRIPGMPHSQTPGMAHTSVMMLTPGAYTARIYEYGNRLDNRRDRDLALRLLAEINIVVTRDGKANDFAFPTGEKQ